MLRFLLWRMLALIALAGGPGVVAWFLGGGLGRVLRDSGRAAGARTVVAAGLATLEGWADAVWRWRAPGGIVLCPSFALGFLAGAVGIALARARARRVRRYVRLQVAPYRGDHAEAEALARMFESLHKRIARRWWRRLLSGQPSLALEVHHETSDGSPAGWLAVCCPCGDERMLEAALRVAYPSCALTPSLAMPTSVPVVLRLKKQREFVMRARPLDRFEHDRDPPVNRLLTVMSACQSPAFVQLALTPTPASFERLARRAFKSHEARLSRRRREHFVTRDRSMVDDAELRGALDVQHRSLFFLDLRIIAGERVVCERIASELRIELAENRLVERGTAIRHGLLGLYTRRVRRGEGNPLASLRKGVFATTELASLWQLPSLDYLTVPVARSGVPLAPAPPGTLRPAAGGTLRDAVGPVSIAESMRKQNTAVPGAVEQGKSSYLVATVAEDVRRARCAVIVLDPKGDAADAAISVVPVERVCTVLDFAHPTCGFNPLAVDAPADVIADYVVTALKTLFTDADIRASSDRYLRNAIIAVLAFDRRSNLWDAARLLSVGEEGYTYRAAVAARVRSLPEFKEIAQFFTAELSAQLADARATTTAKLDAPVNKLARLLNSTSIKRVLLNETLRVDFDRVIAGGEVLIVKGALGAMGAGNTSVLMQLLVGMLDAALARQQDLTPAADRMAVALKVDEAPLVLNRGFAETMALKRSAGLETVACWQTDSQWIDRDVRDQLDALFAHRVYFATSSARDARAAVALTMAEFSDSVRPGLDRISALGHPDVRLHLPRHHAIVSWVTADGRQSPFVAQTIALPLDRRRIAAHAALQHARGARHLRDLRQPHWERTARASDLGVDADAASSRATPPARSEPTKSTSLPAVSAASYRELTELDGAHSARSAKRPSILAPAEVDQIDLEMLESIASLRHVLSSQLHRRFNSGRSPTTTQRRLKRLADAGLVERCQFHRRDGGGVPMSYALSEAGLRMLGESVPGEEPGEQRPSTVTRGGASHAHLRQARHDIHVAGWVFALLALLGALRAGIRGPDRAQLLVPPAVGGTGRGALGPRDLRLPGGRTPHDFLRAGADGRTAEPERFDSLRPDAVVELDASATSCGRAVDVIVELDDRLFTGRAAAKLERYDHFLTGWSAHTRRYGEPAQVLPLVVFVCRDRARARACARSGDSVIRASRAYAGEYPHDWEYQGRELIRFAAERDIHERLPIAYGVPRLPPAVRVAAAHGDRRAGQAACEQLDILSATVQGT